MPNKPFVDFRDISSRIPMEPPKREPRKVPTSPPAKTKTTRQPQAKLSKGLIRKRSMLKTRLYKIPSFATIHKALATVR